ncbi:SDR family NAD(P)-dependent oxidoreductase [Ferrimonas futtsuensis]|uniref:SDR family NAD(P)-dependent oxidoreductase n=1 Tax=Ferrimonas futtsuensis TaxID=364764 RepID=UPI000A022FB7|nr:SDR family oxidoreductase [Ferrimonas futtsuensis]
MRSVILTGVNGGIGSAIAHYLTNQGYKVIGIDISESSDVVDHYISFDLSLLSVSEKNIETLKEQVLKLNSDSDIFALVNNAAIQRLGGVENVSLDDVSSSLSVNVIAPLMLTKAFISELDKANGSVVNIGSIHNGLTKPGFVCYAMSKAALAGMTKSLAVDCGHRIRVNAIQPAAVETDMLVEGFRETPDKLDDLKKYHPTGNIGSPYEVAKLLHLMISDDLPFLNGSVIDINGGIGSRLHDPI